MKAKWLIATALVALLVGGIGTAGAKRLLTGKDIQDRSLHGSDIARGSVTRSNLSDGVQAMLNAGASKQTAASSNPTAGPAGARGEKGDAGPKGDKGDKGDKGAKGDDAHLPTAGNWGVIDRNVIGSPEQELRSGPATPPFGTGSLNLAVQGAPAFPNSAQQEKSAFGNEQDFLGRTLASITQVGFRVFATDTDLAQNPNMPDIGIEVDRNGPAAGAPGFSTLVFAPANSTTPNAWSPYIDGTTVTPAPGPVGWYYTGSGNTCNISNPCTFAGAKADHPDATIFTVAINKGRDFAFQGAVDGLRINNTVYDFEEHGVSQVSAG